MLITSFGYKHGNLDADLIVDCRTLPNPHRVPALRAKSGLDKAVASWVLGSPDARTLIHQALTQVTDYTETIAVGCAAGRHRSVAIAEVLATNLGVYATHRDLQAPSGWTNGSSRTNSTSWKRLRRQAKRQLPYVCVECFVDGEHARLELDHIIPVAEGGIDELRNVQWMCTPCHAEKTAQEAARGRARREARKRRPVLPHPGLIPADPE